MHCNAPLRTGYRGALRCSDRSDGRKLFPGSGTGKRADRFSDIKKLAAAADIEDGTGGIAGGLGEQPDDGASDFTGGAGSLHRDE